MILEAVAFTTRPTRWSVLWTDSSSYSQLCGPLFSYPAGPCSHGYFPYSSMTPHLFGTTDVRSHTSSVQTLVEFRSLCSNITLVPQLSGRCVVDPCSYRSWTTGGRITPGSVGFIHQPSLEHWSMRLSLLGFPAGLLQGAGWWTVPDLTYRGDVRLVRLL